MTVTPAGWYPDGAGSVRWWDGSGWTDQVHPSPASPEQETSSRGRTIGLIALAVVVVAALVGIALLIRKPPAVTADCNDLASIASGVNGPIVSEPRLQQLTNAVVVQDNSRNYHKPSGPQPALVYSCQGLGTFSDGSRQQTLVRLTYTSSGTYVVNYGP